MYAEAARLRRSSTGIDDHRFAGRTREDCAKDGSALIAEISPCRPASWSDQITPVPSLQRVERAGGGGGVVEPEPSERWTMTLSAQWP